MQYKLCNANIKIVDDDEDFYKAKNAGISDTQAYKQAGNSIVVNVLEYIYKMFFNLIVLDGKEV